MFWLLFNFGVDGFIILEGEEMIKVFIKSDIFIIFLLNCFCIWCFFNNVFNNILLKGEFIGGIVLLFFYYVKWVVFGYCCNLCW